MISRTFIQLSATALTLEASYFLIKSNLGLSPENIIELSSTNRDRNTHVARSLVRQQIETKVGLVLLLLSFLFQLWNDLRPLYLADTGSPDPSGCVLAVLLAVAVLVISLTVSRQLQRVHMARVETLVREQDEQREKDKQEKTPNQAL